MKSSLSMWRYAVNVKSTVKISSIYVAFLENTNFTTDFSDLWFPRWKRVKDMTNKLLGPPSVVFSLLVEVRDLKQLISLEPHPSGFYSPIMWSGCNCNFLCCCLLLPQLHFGVEQKPGFSIGKVEIFLEQREVSFLSPSKICKFFNFSTEIEFFGNFARW